MAELHAAGPALAGPDSIDFGPVRIGSPVTDSVRIAAATASEWLVDSAAVSGEAFGLWASPFTGSPITVYSR